LDEGLGDFQLPLSLTPRASSPTSHAIHTANVIEHPSSLQHNVVLHSNINESSIISPSNLFIDNDPSKHPTINLMTVYEQGSTNDLIVEDSGHVKSSTTEEKQMV
jgi:hypothetical protein